MSIVEASEKSGAWLNKWEFDKLFLKIYEEGSQGSESYALLNYVSIDFVPCKVFLEANISLCWRIFKGQ